MSTKTVTHTTSATADDLLLRIVQSNEKTNEKLCQVANKVEKLSSEFVTMQKDVNEKIVKLDERVTKVEKNACILL